MMLLRAQALALGHSGVRGELIDLLVAMLNADVTRASPRKDRWARPAISRRSRTSRSP